VNDKRKSALHVRHSPDKSPQPSFIKGGQGGIWGGISHCERLKGAWQSQKRIATQSLDKGEVKGFDFFVVNFGHWDLLRNLRLAFFIFNILII